ncbi:MAG: hypothetical protein RhofKO_04710 [Rhodothermales bacterium]
MSSKNQEMTVYKESGFWSNFDEERREAIATEMVRAHAFTLAWTDVHGSEVDSVSETLAYLEEALEYEVMPQREDLERLLVQNAEDIESERYRRRVEIEHEELTERYFEERRKGRTALSVARSLKRDPADLMRLVERTAPAHVLENQTQAVRLMRAVRAEEHDLKAFRARQKVFKAITDKIEAALAERSFEDVKTDKLVDMMLRMMELQREDRQPQRNITVQYKSL